MIGVARDLQGQGAGYALLTGIGELAHKVANYVAVRFLVADANPVQVWYERQGWVKNVAQREEQRNAAQGIVSMRYDLS